MGSPKLRRGLHGLRVVDRAPRSEAARLIFLMLMLMLVLMLKPYMNIERRSHIVVIKADVHTIIDPPPARSYMYSAPGWPQRLGRAATASPVKNRTARTGLRPGQ